MRATTAGATPDRRLAPEAIDEGLVGLQPRGRISGPNPTDAGASPASALSIDPLHLKTPLEAPLMSGMMGI